ncbi:MAG TPA: Tm-1-like ATP-binding domain-containing protein [Thermodesulfobacteriota bacterium]|nr:Tm-1-like ATP-binding domain-containing protein [Thermodesulfobacteriota bacterium]
MKKPILIIGTFDTKSEELQFLRDQISARGHLSRTLDTGVLAPSPASADITNENIAEAGGRSLGELVSRGDRGEAVAVMAQGAAKITRMLFDKGEISGVISLGGGSGTAIGAGTMRTLPVGFPKLMVSSMASGNVRTYVGTSDITMMPSVVDISGLNRISRRILRNAALAICGMVEGNEEEASTGRPVIAATMFGVTTPCVTKAKRLLEEHGYEVLVFHANGPGGMAMEQLIGDGVIAAVLDITTTELPDELCGGKGSAGPRRLERAGEMGLPQIVVPGAMDMVNYFPDAVPAPFRGRLLYTHNPATTLMRTNEEENARLGEIMASKLSKAKGPAAVYIPLGGFSAVDAPGKPFHHPAANAAFIRTLKANLPSSIPVVEKAVHINDPAFAAVLVNGLLDMIKAHNKRREDK